MSDSLNVLRGLSDGASLSDADPKPKDGMVVMAKGVFAKGLKSGKKYTLKEGPSFNGQKTFNFMVGSKVHARFAEGDVERFMRGMGEGDQNGLVVVSDDSEIWDGVRVDEKKRLDMAKLGEDIPKAMIKKANAEGLLIVAQKHKNDAGHEIRTITPQQFAEWGKEYQDGKERSGWTAHVIYKGRTFKESDDAASDDGHDYNSEDINDSECECQECGKKFKKKVGPGSSPKCPKCGSTDVDLVDAVLEDAMRSSKISEPLMVAIEAASTEVQDFSSDLSKKAGPLLSKMMQAAKDLDKMLKRSMDEVEDGQEGDFDGHSDESEGLGQESDEEASDDIEASNEKVEYQCGECDHVMDSALSFCPSCGVRFEPVE